MRTKMRLAISVLSGFLNGMLITKICLLALGDIGLAIAIPESFLASMGIADITYLLLRR